MRRTMVLSVAGLCVTACAAHAQGAGPVLDVWPGVAPGSEHWTQTERTIEHTPLGTVVQNVVHPTLTAFLPERAKATGTAVIVAPGGAFVALALSLEGTDAARWLQQRGIAAFVLKYRTVEKRSDGIPAMDMDTAGRYGIADGIQALRVVRRHAAGWGIAADRVGILGFSAGAMVASGALLQPDAAARPSFAALIYGAPFGAMPLIPATLPPVFLAWAQDDAVARAPVVRFHDALLAAGGRPEVHVFSAGGHGFGMRRQGTSSDHWAEALYHWLDAQGLTRRAGRPAAAQAAQAAQAPDAVPAHDTLTVASRALGEARRINVYTPTAYATAPTTRFPVLYMPDGGVDEDFPHVVATVDSLIALGRIRPVIVVGVPNTERRRDLTGPTRAARDSAIAPHVGGSAAFRRFLRDELVPAIDARYRTTAERGIVGESLAGLFVVETFLTEPALFAHYVAFDPSLWWDGGALVDSAAARLAALPVGRRTLYLASSRDDVDDRTARLAATLRAARPRGLGWTHVPRPDLTHATIFRAAGPAALAAALR